MLTTSKEMLLDAAKNGYAVPAINTQGGNYDIIWAICKAAEDLHSPIILAHYVSTGAYSGHDWFVNVCKWCADRCLFRWQFIWIMAMDLTSAWKR